LDSESKPSKNNAKPVWQRPDAFLKFLSYGLLIVFAGYVSKKVVVSNTRAAYKEQEQLNHERLFGYRE
jgi:hypothetical protein